MKKVALISFLIIIPLLGYGIYKYSLIGTTHRKTSVVKIIKVDGSSTVYPITEAVAEKFNARNSNIRVTVGISGTGGGFRKFIRNEVDVTDASRPIKDIEDSICRATGIEYIELPIAFDGLAVVVNPENTWVDYLTVDELKRMWEPEAQNKIMYWNQIRSGWPHEEIHLFGAGTQSGTFDYFTEAIVGKSKNCRGDYTASENDNILVHGISNDRLALGFLGLDYYRENKSKLKLIPIDDKNDTNGIGSIFPTSETVRNSTYQPLTRPLFIYVSKKSLERNEVSNFISFYLNNSENLVSRSGYVPLTNEIYSLVKKRYEDRITGSGFLKTDSDVGITMEGVLGNSFDNYAENKCYFYINRMFSVH